MSDHEPTRTLPDHPDDEQLRRQAKELLGAYREGKPDAVVEVERRFDGASPESLTLSQAQLVLARAYGHASWPKLMLEVERRQPVVRQLGEAMNAGDAAAVAALLGESPWLRERLDRPWFDFGSTALIQAVRANHRGVVEALLDAGADPTIRSDWEMGPFSALELTTDPEMAALLVRRGAPVDACAAAHLGDVGMLARILERDPTQVHQRGGDGKQPLHFAANTEAVDLLLEHGADLEGRCIDHHSTPVMYAVTERPAVARHLLNRGAVADAFLAIGLDDDTLLARLLEDRPERSSLRLGEGELATPPGIMLMYAWTLHVGWGDPGPVPLHAAAGMNRARSAEILLEHGADVHARGGYDDSTPLHVAAWNGSLDTAQVLLDHGADPDLESGPEHRQPAMGWAIVAGRIEMVEMMLERGAAIFDHYVRQARTYLDGSSHTGQPPEAYATIERMLFHAADARGTPLDPTTGHRISADPFGSDPVE